MLTTLALFSSAYCLVLGFKRFMRPAAGDGAAGARWRSVSGYAVGALLSFAAAIFVIPAFEAWWQADRVGEVNMYPPQVQPQYADVGLEPIAWDPGLNGSWLCSDARLESLTFADETFQESLAPTDVDEGKATPAAGKATLWEDQAGNRFLQLESNAENLDVYAASFADGETAFLPPQKSACFEVGFLSQDVLSLRYVNLPFNQKLDFFVNAGLALQRAPVDRTPTPEEMSLFRELSDHLMSFAADGRLPRGKQAIADASGISDTAQRDAVVAMTGYWLPVRSLADGEETESPAVYRFFFNEGVFYQWTTTPYSFQASFFALRTDVTPAEFDLHFEVNGRMERLHGIYEVNDKRLIMCWGAVERPTEFESVFGDGRKLIEFDRLSP